uniref:Major histocompatibility complex class I UBA n=1 Tax=Lepisosteus oculatus TaxID=7918 RepID=W5LXP7_LEPOC
FSVTGPAHFMIMSLVVPGTHSYQYIYTATVGMSEFPEFVVVGMVDGEQVNYYDSSIKEMIPRREWVKGAVDPDFWNRGTQILLGWQQTFKAGIEILRQRFNQTGGVHTWQLMYGCELDSDGTTRGYFQFGYDGADYISLDKSTLTWTAANQRAVITKNKWDATGADARFQTNYLENTCIEWVKKYVEYGRETLLRTERPQVSVYSRVSGSQGPEVTCLATGFFPKDIVVHLQRDGQDLQEDVHSGEVLPNGDGSFQVRKSLRVSEEELKRHQYSCRVDH